MSGELDIPGARVGVTGMLAPIDRSCHGHAVPERCRLDTIPPGLD